MESRITHIPWPGGSGRIKTGPMAFEGDWPGFFFRGDEVPLSMLREIAMLLREGSHDAYADWVDGLVNQMADCRVSPYYFEVHK